MTRELREPLFILNPVSSPARRKGCRMTMRMYGSTISLLGYEVRMTYVTSLKLMAQKGLKP